MKIKLYNTFSGKKEDFNPIHSNRVSMYVCGPTVYSSPHIGNARGPVVFDVLAKLLRMNYELTYVRNITDLDDKIYQAAKDEETGIDTITQRYTDIYQEDIKALGVNEPDVEPRATDHVPQMIEMITKLLSASHAYVKDEHVLFSVDSFPDYGQLSNRKQEDLISGSRVEIATYKNNPNDFVLWKPSTSDLPGWDSPWGFGRPGWHLECSTMAKSYLGETIDIHGGGSDLIFPHHENELAQSMCSHLGKNFCNYWVHHGLVDFKKTKMSKSEGNILLVRDILSHSSGETIRLALLSTQYRQLINWSESLLSESKKKLDRLYRALESCPNDGLEGQPSEKVLRALCDDLNTPMALAELFKIAREINSTKDKGKLVVLASKLKASSNLLGLLQSTPDQWFKSPVNDSLPPKEIEVMIKQRELARSAKNFSEADEIRNKLLRSGVIIEDGPDGTQWKFLD
jgi:cysteinyl-tRNA synthetase